MCGVVDYDHIKASSSNVVGPATSGSNQIPNECG